MKKNILLCLLLSFCSISSSYAIQKFSIPSKKALFSSVGWFSKKPSDLIFIEKPVGDSNVYEVQIYVSQNSLDFANPPSGILVNNCFGPGTTNSVSPGSSLICTLDNNGNNRISFSALKDPGASGTYQVQ